MSNSPLENHGFAILDLIKTSRPKPKPMLKWYEIWLGWYHLGQGSHPPTKPEKVGEIEATDFEVACCIYEHQLAIESLMRRMLAGDTYIKDIHFGTWNYNPKTNSNSWTGKYYQSYEEALNSFK